MIFIVFKICRIKKKLKPSEDKNFENSLESYENDELPKIPRKVSPNHENSSDISQKNEDYISDEKAKKL